jgi:UDP-N-acetylmuramoyl-tripeptide--D-alanyl-D-alanine ligase
MNALAVVAAIGALTGRFDTTQRAASALADFGAQAGRGQREILRGAGGHVLLADESYNANPASMRAALMALALVPRSEYPRRIAVLGDMLELGARSRELHEGLSEAIEAAGIDVVFAAGPHMKSLFDRLPSARRGAWAATSAELAPLLRGRIGVGDAIVVKGSYGSRMGPLVDAIKSEFSVGEA